MTGYVLRISPTVGLCAIGASGKTIESNSFGEQIRTAFDNVRQSLESRYGAPTSVTDELTEGSIWHDPQDFMMGLYKQERQLRARWSDRNTGDGLRTILVSAAALTSSTAFVTLNYWFDNFDQCKAETDSQKAQVY